MLYTDAGLTTLAAAGTDYAAAGNALTLYFVPAANWNGSTGFQFTATDGGGLADATPATATINVAAVNDAPSANDVVANGTEDDPQIAITLTGSDVEGPVASFRITGALPANGTLYTDARLTTVAVSGIDYAAAGNALTLYFVPAANWNGTTGFQFTATDGGGLLRCHPGQRDDQRRRGRTTSRWRTTSSPTATRTTRRSRSRSPASDVEGPVASFRLAGLPANGLLYTDALLTTLAAAATDYAAVGNALTLYFVPAANWNGAAELPVHRHRRRRPVRRHGRDRHDQRRTRERRPARRPPTPPRRTRTPRSPPPTSSSTTRSATSRPRSSPSTR